MRVGGGAHTLVLVVVARGGGAVILRLTVLHSGQSGAQIASELDAGGHNYLGGEAPVLCSHVGVDRGHAGRAHALTALTSSSAVHACREMERLCLVQAAPVLPHHESNLHLCRCHVSPVFKSFPTHTCLII